MYEFQGVDGAKYQSLRYLVVFGMDDQIISETGLKQK
jgi:hypothetical protein